MDWQWSWDFAVMWWVLLSGMIGFIALVLLTSGAYVTGRGVALSVVITLIADAALMALTGAVNYNVGANARQNMSYATVASTVFGLKSGEAYPLELGSRSGGTQVHGEVSGHGFSIVGSVSSAPNSSFPVSFQQESKTYMLDLPARVVTFDVRTDREPSVTLVINDIDPANGNNVGTALGTVRYPHCRPLIHNFVATCVPEGEWIVSPSDQTVRQGLAPIVQDGLDSATIVLTPEMYAQLLGKIS